MNELKIFENPVFGKIRTIDVDGKIHFVASDVAKSLGYARPNDAISTHCRYTVKRRIPHPQSKSASIEVNVIPEGDIYRLVANSQLPAAQKFESWIFDEVIPSVRKTGTYSISEKPDPKYEIQLARARAMETNSRVRAAQTWLKIAAVVNIPEYKQIASTYAANTLAKKKIMQLPEAERKTYSATEIGKMFGVSANMIGKIANTNNLKTPEYGKLFYDKSRNSRKEVETWRYYDAAIPAFANLVEKSIGA